MMDSSETKRDARLVVFTDLDGALLDYETYSFSAASEALELLQRHEIPVVVCSSKTHAEIEHIQLDLRLRHPFISENGGAIFLPREYFLFTPDGVRSFDGYDVIEFGAPYWQLVEALHRISAEVGIRVVGFSDMSVEQVAQDCKFSSAQARLAKLREHDEPFRILDSSPAVRSRLLAALHKAGLSCARDGRHYHLTGVTDKWLAIRKLRSLYEQAWGSVLTVGLGDSPNDLPLLQEVDLPIVVRNPAVGASTRLLRKVPTALISSEVGPRGWNEMMLKVIEQHVG